MSFLVCKYFKDDKNNSILMQLVIVNYPILGILCNTYCTVLYRDKTADLSPDVVNALYFLEQFVHYGNLPRKAIEKYIPSYIFDEFKHATS